MYKYFMCLFVFAMQISVNSNAEEISVAQEEIIDFNESTGVGCLVKADEIDSSKASIVCKSKISDEYAWNAVQYRAKIKCESQKFSVFFNKPPTLPVNKGIHTAQMDIKCEKP